MPGPRSRMALLSFCPGWWRGLRRTNPGFSSLCFVGPFVGWGLADNEFGYHKRSMLREIMPLLMVAAPMELVVVHLLAHTLSPWEWLK